jgi:hypothetical protein
VLEFTRRVERIDVHHHEPGAQHRGHRDGVLRHVGHHDRDPVAAAQALRLQVRCERARGLVDLRERERLAHEAIRRQRFELAKTLVEQGHQRGILLDVDGGRHALRVLLEPGLLHRVLQVWRSNARLHVWGDSH